MMYSFEPYVVLKDSCLLYYKFLYTICICLCPKAKLIRFSIEKKPIVFRELLFYACVGSNLSCLPENGEL